MLQDELSPNQKVKLFGQEVLMTILSDDEGVYGQTLPKGVKGIDTQGSMHKKFYETIRDNPSFRVQAMALGLDTSGTSQLINAGLNLWAQEIGYAIRNPNEHYKGAKFPPFVYGTKKNLQVFEQQVDDLKQQSELPLDDDSHVNHPADRTFTANMDNKLNIDPSNSTNVETADNVTEIFVAQGSKGIRIDNLKGAGQIVVRIFQQEGP